MATKKISTLKDWIDETGIYEVSALLRCDTVTVKNWHRGFCLPTSDKMLKIEKFTKKRLTMGSMTSDYWAEENKKNRWQSKQ